MYSRTYDAAALLIGRLIVGGVFLWAAADNLLELDAKSGYAASKGVVAPTALVTLASLILLAGSISILVGFRPILGVAAIALFLVPVTLMMHNFWALTGLQQILELHNFQGNVIMLGSAVMFLAIPRPWPFSVDGWLRSTRGAVAESPVRVNA
jgi:putative oxidoreductase